MQNDVFSKEIIIFALLILTIMHKIIKKEDLRALILSKIYVIRGTKVMLDRDLADLYGVETRTLNQKVKRNMRRFPPDFMFQMTKEDMEEWKSQIVISNSIKMGLRKPPFAFSLFGVAMLSSVLKSEVTFCDNILLPNCVTML